MVSLGDSVITEGGGEEKGRAGGNGKDEEVSKRMTRSASYMHTQHERLRVRRRVGEWGSRGAGGEGRGGE